MTPESKLKQSYTRQEVVEILAKYLAIIRMELDLTVLETSSKIRIPKPAKWFNKNFK